MMRILYTPAELDRTARWYRVWFVAMLVLAAVRILWFPGQSLRLSETACGFLGFSLWAISKSRSSSDFRSFAVCLGSISGLMCAGCLIVQFFGLRNIPGPRWLAAIDFALGTRILLRQIVILASACVCHRQWDDADEFDSEPAEFPKDPVLVTVAV